jgi:hypothetical protein
MAVNIEYVDLIGQPTWIQPPNIIQVKVVMRCDIHCGGYVNLPPVQVTLSQAASFPGGVQAKAGLLTFYGSCQVIFVRHTGNYYSPEGSDWCTIFNATVNISNAENVTNMTTPTSAPSGPSGPAIAVPSPPPPPTMGPQSVMIRNVRRY